MISPCKSGYRDPRLAALNWQERDKEQFATLKLMMQVDEQVRQRQLARSASHFCNEYKCLDLSFEDNAKL